MPEIEKKTYYDLLGVAPDATGEGVEAAYEARLTAASPSESRKLKIAHGYLSNPVLRRLYDWREGIAPRL